MAKLFIITENWNEQPWFSTGGTRAKKYLQSPDGSFYYFKRSQLRPGKDYTFEFWNEIIAYELGTMLGFHMLRYDIAIDGEVMGCICQSMIDADQEELIEGVKYLQAYSPDYDPTKKEHQKWYTFHLIEQALQSARVGHFIDDVIKVIIFDSLIGNSDRHQENWALISRQQLITDLLIELKKKDIIKPAKKYLRLLKWLKSSIDQKKDRGEKISKLLYRNEIKFSPIYDSGSSLGRELLDERVLLFLNSESDLKRYIDRGTSEIHWDHKKVSHFELISSLLKSSYKEATKNMIEGLLVKFDEMKFAEMLHEIDREVPDTLMKYRIPDNRKQLIIKMVTLRLEKLRRLIYEGI